MPTVTIAIWALVGCRADPLEKYLQPWGCDVDASPERLDVTGDGRLTEDDLEPGQSAIRMRWIEPPSDEVVLSVRQDSDAELNPFFDEPTWGIWHRVGCEVEAGLHLWFPAVTVDTPVTITSLSIDIPALEQGSRMQPETPTYDASVVLGDVNSVGLTGHVDGAVELPLYSNLTGQFMGQRVQIEAFAFRQVPW